MGKPPTHTPHFALRILFSRILETAASLQLADAYRPWPYMGPSAESEAHAMHDIVVRDGQSALDSQDRVVLTAAEQCLTPICYSQSTYSNLGIYLLT